MPHRSYILIIFITLSFRALAQSTSAIYYFNHNGTPVTLKDSADFYRVIDSQTDAGFRFTEYRKDGSWVKASAKGSIEKPVYDGYVNWYYKNGNPCEMHEYTNNMLTKTSRYHQNGTLLQVIIYNTPGLPYDRLMYEADSTGKANITDGKGTRTETGTRILGKLTEHYTITGSYLNGSKQGTWEGTNNWGTRFKEKYKQGHFVSGKSNASNGKSYKYNYQFEYPIYKDGKNKFEAWIKRNLATTSDTLHLKNFASKRLMLSYLIDEKGNPGSFKGLNRADSTEITITLKHKPDKWQPATLRGVPVSYTLSYYQYTPDSNKPAIWHYLETNLIINRNSSPLQ